MEQAIYADCRSIINKFEQNGDPHFKSFCLQWKQKMFHHIYSAQSSTTEMLQTTATALHVAKRVLCQEDPEDRNLLRRIGALYLIYAIYFKQPTKQFMKVDVTLPDWGAIQKFIVQLDNDLDSTATDEPRYIFWKLYSENAFRFCAHDFDLGLENLVDYNRLGEQSTDSNASGAVAIEHRDLWEHLERFTTTDSMLPALTTLEAGYNEMKELLVKKAEHSGDGVSQLNRQTLSTSDIFKHMQTVFEDISLILSGEDQRTRKIRRKKQSGKDGSINVDRRKDLKRKGFTVTQTKDGLKIDSAQSSNKLRVRAACRMSAKTIFAENLPAETLKDLQGDNEEAIALESDDDDDEMSDQKEFILKIEN